MNEDVAYERSVVVVVGNLKHGQRHRLRTVSVLLLLLLLLSLGPETRPPTISSCVIPSPTDSQCIVVVVVAAAAAAAAAAVIKT